MIRWALAAALCFLSSYAHAQEGKPAGPNAPCSAFGFTSTTCPQGNLAAPLAAPAFTGAASFSGVPIFSGLSAGTQVSCLGLDSGNHLVLNAAACGSGGGGAVSSVFGRTGAVVAASNDYSFSQLSGNYTLAQGPTIGANTVLGSTAGGTPAALTQTQLTSLVNVVTTSLSGAVPTLPNDASKFLNGVGSYIQAVASITLGAGTGGGSCSTACSISTAFLTDSPSAGAFPYAVPNTDWGKIVVIPSGAGNLTIASAATTGFTAGFSVWIVNEDSATRTLTPTTSTISGKSSVPIPAGNTLCIQSDGSQYHFCVPPSLAVANNLADLNNASTARTNLGLGTAAVANTGTSGANLPFLNGTNTWSGAQTINSGDLVLAGSGSGSSTLNAPATGGGTATLFAGSDTIAGLSLANGGTNASLTASNGGIVYSTGSAFAILAGTVTASQCLLSGSSSAPSWGSCGSGSGNALFGTTTGNVANNIVTMSNTTVGVKDSGTALSSLAPLASPSLTGTTSIVTLTTSGTVTFNASFVSTVTAPGSTAVGAMRNTSANAAAAGVFNFGNNTSNTEVAITLNSSANATGNGTSSLTFNNTEATNTGGIFFQTQGTNALTISKAQAIGIPGIASSSAAQTGTLCWTTGTGNITVDTTVGCLTSLREAKDIHRRPSPQQALDITTRLSLIDFNYRKGWQDNGQYEQYGLVADEVAAVDERLVGRDPSGKLQGVRYMELSAVNSAAIARLQEEIEDLKRTRH